MDLVLSSGFLAFARHLGVVQAIEERGTAIEAVCGTSSGALVGALWAAGCDAVQIARELGRDRPLAMMRLGATPWRGLFTLDALAARMRALLPARFDQLRRPLAVGVRDPAGHYRLLTDGPLPEAVAASCAIPHVFRPVLVDGVRFADGGAADRVGLGAWGAWRGARTAVVHIVDRRLGREVPADLDGHVVVRSARSRASFFGLGDFAAQAAETRALALAALAAAERPGASP